MARAPPFRSFVKRARFPGASGPSRAVDGAGRIRAGKGGARWRTARVRLPHRGSRVSDDVVVQARNLAPHLVEGTAGRVCGRGSALAAYLLAQLYDLAPRAGVCRFGTIDGRLLTWFGVGRALLRAFSDDCADLASSRFPLLFLRDADDDDDGASLLEAGVVRSGRPRSSRRAPIRMHEACADRTASTPSACQLEESMAAASLPSRSSSTSTFSRQARAVCAHDRARSRDLRARPSGDDGDARRALPRHCAGWYE